MKYWPPRIPEANFCVELVSDRSSSVAPRVRVSSPAMKEKEWIRMCVLRVYAFRNESPVCSKEGEAMALLMKKEGRTKEGRKCWQGRDDWEDEIPGRGSGVRAKRKERKG